jgi:hypothetical protein
MKHTFIVNFIVLLFCCMTSAAHAQESTTRTLRASELRADKSSAAPILQSLPNGAVLRLISLEGGWAMVDVAGQKGWIRASSLNLEAGKSNLSIINTGRQANGTVINAALTLGVRSMPPRANRHALIINISEYAVPSISALPGAKHDKESAIQMAQAMQVPESNMYFLSDAQATGVGVRKALQDLNDRVLPGDRVFVYYSGHGTRYFDKEANGCVEAIMTHDGTFEGMVSNRELAQLLKPVTDKTDKLFVMYDACHSGGLLAQNKPATATRGLNAEAEDKITAKFSMSSEQCAIPSNMRSRSLGGEQNRLGALPQDIIHVSASRDNEVSFEDSGKGGFATQFMRDCMLRDAKDLDGSGALSMEEIAQCAQGKINERLRGVSGLQAHNIQLTGNKLFIPAWFSQLTPVAQQAGNSALVAMNSAVAPTASVQAPQKPLATSVPSAQAPLVTPNITGQQALNQMFSQRDAKRRLQVILSQDKLVIGKDYLDMTIQSERSGYVYVAMAGSDNQSLYLLFPNALDSDNRIQALQQLTLPRNSWRVKAAGPVGKDTLLVMVADSPRDLKQLQQMQTVSTAGPFLKSLNDAQGRAQLGMFMSNSWIETANNCKKREPLNVQCSDAYSAVVVSVEEIVY